MITIIYVNSSYLVPENCIKAFIEETTHHDNAKILFNEHVLSWEKYPCEIDQEEGQANRDAIFHVATSKGGLYKLNHLFFSIN